MRYASSLGLSSPTLKIIRGLYSLFFPLDLGGKNRQCWHLGWVPLGCPNNLPGDIYCSLRLALSCSVSPVLDPEAWLAVSTGISECAQVPRYPYPVTTAPSVSAVCGSPTAPGDWSYSSVSGSLSLHLSDVEGCHLRERGAALLGRTRRSKETAGWWEEGKEGRMKWQWGLTPLTHTCTHTLTHTKTLRHLEVTSPEDRGSLACIHVTSWPCFLLFPSTLLPQFCLHGFFKPIVPLSLSGKFEAASTHLVTPLMKCRSCAPVSSSRAPRGLVTFGCSLLTAAHASPFPNVQCHPGKLKFSAPKRGIQEVFLSVLCKNINDVFFCDLILRHSWTVSAEFSREFQPQAYIWPGKFQPKWLKFGKVYMHLKVVLIMESVRLF